jgi:hypothetical protein
MYFNCMSKNSSAIPQPRSTTEIVTRIVDAHRERLGTRLSGIILCGSLGTKRYANDGGSDIDYLVVVDTLTVSVAQTLADIRAQLSLDLGYSMSNTVLCIRDLEQFSRLPETLDPKACQALLEASGAPARVVYKADTFVAYNVPSEAAIATFSRQNFYGLRAVLRKKMIRGIPDISFGAEDLQNTAKICLIILKLKVQISHPDAFVNNSEHEAPFWKGRLSSQDFEWYQELTHLKRATLIEEGAAENFIDKVLLFLEQMNDYCLQDTEALELAAE